MYLFNNGFFVEGHDKFSIENFKKHIGKTTSVWFWLI